jgi:hypothetical protein
LRAGKWSVSSTNFEDKEWMEICIKEYEEEKRISEFLPLPVRHPKKIPEKFQ